MTTRKIALNFAVAMLALLGSQASLLIGNPALKFTLNASLFYVYLLATLAVVAWLFWPTVRGEEETA